MTAMRRRRRRRWRRRMRRKEIIKAMLLRKLRFILMIDWEKLKEDLLVLINKTFLQILLALWEELVSFIERIKIKNEIAFSRKK
jgi:hypothetical protein